MGSSSIAADNKWTRQSWGHWASALRRMKHGTVWLSLVLFAIASGCNEDAGHTAGGKPKTDGAGSGVVGVDAVRKLSQADFLQALGLKNRGIAHLENKEWTAADAALSELAELIPRDRLAIRNLAVSRVLALIDRESPFTRSGPPENVARFNEAVNAAREAITNFAVNASESYDRALADLLLGKLLIHSHAPETPTLEAGLAALRRAADAEPDAADFEFAVAMAMDGDRDYSDGRNPQSAQLLEALGRSFQLAPDNLFALQKLLQRQALFLNASNESTKQLASKITDTLQTAVELLAPLNESIKKQRRLDLIDTITKTLGTANETNSANLMQPAMITANLLLPEIATQIDQRRLNRNLLEYLLLEFDADFLDLARTSGAIPEPAPMVIESFTRVVDKLGLPPENVLPALDGVTDFQIVDMNLDGFDDIVVVGGGVVRVFSRGTDPSAAWRPMMKSPEGHNGLTHLLLADIDRDYDKALSDIKNPSLLRDADGDQKIVTDLAGKNRWYDTDLDVIAWGIDGVVVMRNSLAEDGTRLLEILPQDESLTAINDVVAADLEADGDLDLIFATDSGMTLWQNTDGTHFQNINAAASLPKHALVSLSVVDWNQDVAIDVVGLGPTGELGVLENNFHGRFRWKSEPYDAGQDKAFWVAPKVARSGWRAIGSQTMEFGDALVSAISADFDNDGNADVLGVSGTDTTLVRGHADGSFAVTDLIQLDEPLQAMAAADLDDDGDLDIVGTLTDRRQLTFLRNNGGNTNNWIDVVARAVPDDPQFPSNRVNMHGIGSTIEVRTGGLYQRQVISSPKVHLGLGKATAADAIRIIWTDGIPQNITVPDLLKPRIGILAPQILKGSCPYIYTWTGERFEFFSDCLWAAPLGLVQANGDLAPTREWENLLIPGEALVEKDGRYILQLTEELWETAYFDQVQLTAIDHPADVSIFTNEKVGPPSIAAHRVHTVQNPRSPKSIIDRRGNDLRPGLTERDGNFIQPFAGRVMQGLTDPWLMEFDLGRLQSPQNIRLFLTGWVFPTDTSLNLGIVQDPQTHPPVPPAIEVPDGKGGWRIAMPFIGFPSGKTKAMVVDLTGVFEGDDYRFRLTSSMELYWDQAFFTVDESDAHTQVQSCPLNGGDLHFRGFSRRVYESNALFRDGYAPESYDYASITTEPRWPPISGRFTRYGNTTELLTAHDDRMVVMGPGDELTVTFDVPPAPVPPGWTRDFVLTNIGYDKDADLNTIYGQSSEPFPFKAMSHYPFAEGDKIPASPAYLRHLDNWQTREYSAQPFWNAVLERRAARTAPVVQNRLWNDVHHH